MWHWQYDEDLQAQRFGEREEEEIYERACTLLCMAVSALFGSVMTLFVLSILGHLK